MAQLYDFPAPPNAAGQTIGIIEFGGGYKLADVQAFFGGLNLPVPTITDVPGLGGVTNSPGSADDIENLLDIGVAGSVAPGARIVVYYDENSENGLIDVISKAIHDETNNPSVLSISWIWSEAPWVTGLSPRFPGRGHARRDGVRRQR